MDLDESVKVEDWMPKPSVIGSSWCVECKILHGKKVYAEYTYSGNSLCEKCFNEAVVYETT